MALCRVTMAKARTSFTRPPSRPRTPFLVRFGTVPVTKANSLQGVWRMPWHMERLSFILLLRLNFSKLPGHQDFASVYTDKLKFFKDVNPNDIWVRTSTEDRTYQVAGGILYGIDASLDQQVFKVHNEPATVNMDDLVYSALSAHMSHHKIDSLVPSYSCPNADAIRNQYQSVPAWTDHLNQNADLKARLDATLGTAGLSAWSVWCKFYVHFPQRVLAQMVRQMTTSSIHSLLGRATATRCPVTRQEHVYHQKTPPGYSRLETLNTSAWTPLAYSMHHVETHFTATYGRPPKTPLPTTHSHLVNLSCPSTLPNGFNNHSRPHRCYVPGARSELPLLQSRSGDLQAAILCWSRRVDD
jgi:hypothetical protein